MQRQTDILGHWSCGYRNVRERTSSLSPFSLPPYLEGQASHADLFIARPLSPCSPHHALDMARQLQMLSSSLIQRAEFKRVMYGGAGFVPEVRFLQRWIEVCATLSNPFVVPQWSRLLTACLSSHQAAWHAGFDVDGCAQLGGSLAGKSTWIGPSEVVALLRSFGVKAVLISVRGEEQASSDITPRSQSQLWALADGLTLRLLDKMHEVQESN